MPAGYRLEGDVKHTQVQNLYKTVSNDQACQTIKNVQYTTVSCYYNLQSGHRHGQIGRLTSAIDPGLPEPL